MRAFWFVKYRSVRGSLWFCHSNSDHLRRGDFFEIIADPIWRTAEYIHDVRVGFRCVRRRSG